MATECPKVDYLCKTREDSIKTSILWTIDNFSLCPEKTEEYLESFTFFAKKDIKTKWYLRLYPNGDKEEKKKFVSLYLFLKESNNEEVLAKFNLAIIDGKHQIYKQLECIRLFNKNGNEQNEKYSGWGYAGFISKSLLKNPNKELLPNDRLNIYCCVTTFNENGFRDQKIEMKTIKDYMTELYKNLNDCDIDIVVKGYKLVAHKFVLKIRSPVFEAMFKHQMKENIQNQVIIEDIEKEVFERVLQFIYTDKVVDKDIDSNIKLLFAANKYILDDLKAICEQKISSQLTVENVFDVLILAETHSAKELKNAAIVFIERNCGQLKTISDKSVNSFKGFVKYFLKRLKFFH